MTSSDAVTSAVPSRVPSVAVVDPSGFTLPYDYSFTRALGDAGARVLLFTRELRPGEPPPPSGVGIRVWFYRASERAMRRWPRLTGALRFAKGLEHGIDLLRLSQWCRRDRPDVVHLQWAALPFLDRLILGRLRRNSVVALTVHDTKAFLGSASSPIQYWGWRSTLNEVDQLIVHTVEGVRVLRDQGIRTPIAVIPHGPLEFPAGASAIAEEPEILLFGILKPYKGADLLLEAFARIPGPIRAGWRLRIAGKPQMNPNPLLERAEKLGIASSVIWDLRYLGDAELGGLFARSSILAFPYREIDASGVLMGAVGLRKAIVASRVGAFAELLRDGETALLFPKEDIAGLTRALQSLMESASLRAKLADASYEAFRSRIPSWDAIARTTIDLYRSVGRTKKPT